MAARSHGMHNNPNATNYVNKKGIHELFEAIMTGLMVNKPDDHIAFIRECLDKVQNNPTRLRWDHFLTNSNTTKPVLPSKSSMLRSRGKPLPPVRSSNVAAKPSNISHRQSPGKSALLPPIDINKNSSLHIPIVLILSSTIPTKLCSRLLDRYDGIIYLSINDVANIDEENPINLKKHENRYAKVQQIIMNRRSNANGILLAGHIEESHYYDKWQEHLGKIELVVMLSSGSQTLSNQNVDFTQIDSDSDFDIILAETVRVVDGVLPYKNLTSRSLQSDESKSNSFSLPIIFCIDNHRVLSKDVKNNNNNNRAHRILEHSSIDDEFDISNEETEVEINNSFIYALCERLAEQFSFKHIHFADCTHILLDFEQLKTIIIESMSTCTGYIIEHFPTSLDDFQRFQKEIGSCSALIYIGDGSREKIDNDFGIIIESFKKQDKVIYVDYRMEVDEIFEDLKKDILSRI